MRSVALGPPPAARGVCGARDRGRVKAAHGGRYPRPAELLATTPDELRALGLSRQKAATLHRIAEAFGEGQLSTRRIQRSDDDAVIEQLTALKGIGVWTAHMILIFSLGRPDVLPVGDYGVRKGAWAIYGLPTLPKPAELEAIAECWRPYRSVASWYLWRAADEAGRFEKSKDESRGKASGRVRSKVESEVESKVESEARRKRGESLTADAARCPGVGDAGQLRHTRLPPVRCPCHGRPQEQSGRLTLTERVAGRVDQRTNGVSPSSIG